mmetsp:Transcript_26743/g.48484  ORF Transcript_26743/g.48484 Transcript_26743/m.48484 type:complete len:162 (-) Transcript_26743:191-676(-)|eukprot:CAMPEP_0201623072 /NCGR_PEP_ID=MMETSP0492-20130828/47732_1 /ASSEMBLY_ACC=CAM_ASM_000837 /TAXON_ID=420259 /ORGANISM="Thalassiosira gravida, Strain GMp14c1" /LENGTH=161 /DNA_ID=CAMNT_0048092683 /DNA_START=588 /DNA_END=1073 /DNA_ORIENTATION=+
MHICVLLDLRYPIPNGLERPAIGHVVNEQDPLRAAEVGGGDRAESLLTRRVPNLELDSLAVDFYVLDLKVDADGGDKRGGEGVVGITEEEASFTDAGIADHEQLALHVIGDCVRHGDSVQSLFNLGQSVLFECAMLSCNGDGGTLSVFYGRREFEEKDWLR